MAATLIDGVAIARELYAGFKERVKALDGRSVRPGLAAILIGDNPASEVYVRTKTRACAEAGVHSVQHRFGANASEDEVIGLIERLNADPAIHGILVQLPLPQRLNTERILQAVAATKDVDGFNWCNLGALAAGHPRFSPCTPLGVMTMLEREQVAVEGSTAVVIGRSVIVGKPMALMLIAGGATVTVCNSKTRDLQEYTSRADILVAAAGRPGLVQGFMVKPGAVVIDVGINRQPDGKLVGDVDFASVSLVASRITPVPGGVGRMTVAMLIGNTVTAAERYAAQSPGR
jgi:methylenetetrahydrofolate dehydrogenase (NADP+) / methenyltetrahydrofolate cyclohydrolase